MSPHPILLVGGSGVVGQHTARTLRKAHPDVPLLIGGRDLGKARDIADQVGEGRGRRNRPRRSRPRPRGSSRQRRGRAVHRPAGRGTAFRARPERSVYLHLSRHHRTWARSRGVYPSPGRIRRRPWNGMAGRRDQRSDARFRQGLRACRRHPHRCPARRGGRLRPGLRSRPRKTDDRSCRLPWSGGTVPLSGAPATTRHPVSGRSTEPRSRPPLFRPTTCSACQWRRVRRTCASISV